MGKRGIFRKTIFLDSIYRVAIFNWEQLSRGICPGGNFSLDTFSRIQQSSIVNNYPNILSKILKGISRRVHFTLDLHMLAQTVQENDGKCLWQCPVSLMMRARVFQHYSKQSPKKIFESTESRNFRAANFKSTCRRLLLIYEKHIA